MGNIEPMKIWDDPKLIASTLSRRLKSAISTELSTHSGTLVKSSVLVPVALYDKKPSLIFVLRSKDTRHHSGQIGFPGGIIEKSDPTPLSCALREAEEEVGIQNYSVEIVGELIPTETVTGFLITPYVGLIREKVELKRDPKEIQDVFTVPLERFANGPDGSLEFWVMGKKFFVCSFLFDDFVIWGATARIILNLFDKGLGINLPSPKKGNVDTGKDACGTG